MKSAPFVIALGVCISTVAWAGPFDSLKQAAHDSGANLKGAATADLGQSTSLLKGAAAAPVLNQLKSGKFKLNSPQNVAGVLGYCQKQGWAPNAADTVKSQLMSKLGIKGTQDDNPQYQQGLSGLLLGAENGSFNLSSLKDKLGKKVCSTVANKAISSFL